MSRFVELAFNLPVRKCFTYLLPEGSEARIGYRVSAPFGKRLLTGLVVAERDSPPPGVPEIREVKRVIDSRAVFDEKTLGLARWMARMYMCSLGEALSGMIPAGRREVETEEFPLEEDGRAYELADQQQEAISRVLSAGPGSYYLFGVTGSGKTDVYLHCAKDVASRGLRGDLPRPEISLTHQIVRIFRATFKDRLAVLHSSLTRRSASRSGPVSSTAEWTW